MAIIDVSLLRRGGRSSWSLSNLPGAPGMVHWYDAESASVVGTLKVAPYNRVSRRDAAEPHVPAPAVTHLAVGDRGRRLDGEHERWRLPRGWRRGRDDVPSACSHERLHEHQVLVVRRRGRCQGRRRQIV